jgi:chemotaxis protein CheX
MPPHISVESYSPEETQIISDVFRTMLRLSVEPVAVNVHSETPQVTGAVYFAGAWNGALLVECSHEQSFQFTHRLMSIEPPSSLNDDVRDALGELANMIAGNLKALLPSGSAISMPSVVEGSDYSLRVCGGNDVSRMTFSSDLGNFTVTLVEVRDPAPRLCLLARKNEN